MTNLTITSQNCQVSLDIDCELSVTELSQLILIFRELIDNCTSQDLENIAESANDAVMTMIESVSYKPFTIPDAILRLIK
jgi:hypothetical protein